MSTRTPSRKDEERLAEMRRLYEDDGRTLAEVGKMYGVSRQRVHQIFEKAGVARRGRGRAVEVVPALVLAEMRRLYEDEVLSICEIGRRCNITKDVARKRLVEAGASIISGPRGRPRIEREALHDLYVKQGLSMAAIEAQTGIGRETVRRELGRHGIPARPRYFHLRRGDQDNWMSKAA